jgi:hypothetical protein
MGPQDLDHIAIPDEKLEAWMKQVGAAMWIQHDFVAHSKLKKSPAYYE